MANGTTILSVWKRLFRLNRFQGCRQGFNGWNFRKFTQWFQTITVDVQEYVWDKRRNIRNNASTVEVQKLTAVKTVRLSKINILTGLEILRQMTYEWLKSVEYRLRCGHLKIWQLSNTDYKYYFWIALKKLWLKLRRKKISSRKKNRYDHKRAQLQMSTISYQILKEHLFYLCTSESHLKS